jgi:uncharacterized protein
MKSTIRPSPRRLGHSTFTAAAKPIRWVATEGSPGMPLPMSRKITTPTFQRIPCLPTPDGEQEDYGNDQRYIERRDDVLVFTSDSLRKPLEIVGKVLVHVFAASDACDTDFTAKVLDVYPDGRALALGPAPIGIIRARYRNGRDHTELLTPGKTEHYEIELYDIGHTFLPGHQIRIEISSSYALCFNPNSNTGNPIATDLESHPAKQTIFHDRASPSYVALSVMPNP